MGETKKKKPKNQTIPLPGDVYVKGLAVYRVILYNETEDNVLFATTNDIITLYGKTPRTRIRTHGLYPCPLQLLRPAIQVFELDENLNDESLEKLKLYHLQHVRTYEKLGLPELLEDVESTTTRVYQVPDEQGDQFKDLKGKSFTIPVPFYCLTKEMYKKKYEQTPVSREQYFRAMRHSWPIFYVPSRFALKE
jgi:hypothetical protein